jgi:hypothetical protein
VNDLRIIIIVGDACAQPRIPGEPYGGVTGDRFYYDRTSDECVPFTFNGIRGNQNNFFTQAQCETTCPGVFNKLSYSTVHITVGFRGLCPHGRPLLLLTVPQVCDVENACPRSYVCNVQSQARDQSGVCCPDPGFTITKLINTHTNHFSGLLLRATRPWNV